MFRRRSKPNSALPLEKQIKLFGKAEHISGLPRPVPKKTPYLKFVTLLILLALLVSTKIGVHNDIAVYLRTFLQHFNTSQEVSIILTCQNNSITEIKSSISSILSQQYPSNVLLQTSSNFSLPNLQKQHIANERLEIFQRRQLAVEQIGRIDSNHHFLFLDNCEEFSSTSSLDYIVHAWRIIWKYQNKPSPTFGYTRKVEFLFMNQFKDNPVALEAQYNPYYAAFGYTKSSGTHHHLEKPYYHSSMFINSRVWMDLAKNENDLHKMIFNEDHRITCSENEAFWNKFSMSSLYGVAIPLSVLKLKKSQLLARKQFFESTCQADFYREFKTTTQNKLAQFKRVWAPIVSVIIPFYNVPSHIWFRETMNSLTQQTFTDFDVIIVDDGTIRGNQYKGWEELQKLENNIKDGLYYPIESKNSPIPVRIIHHQKNLGLAEARNTGVKNSRSPYIIFLDPDDILEKTALEKLVLFGAAHISKPIPHRSSTVNYGFVYSGTVHFGSKNDLVYADFSEKALTNENFMTATTLISRDAYIKVGGMCPRTIIRYFEDYDFWLRMASLGYNGKLLREPLFRYRRHLMGQSTNIIRDASDQKKRNKQGGSTSDEYLKEARKNNPVVFGDATFNQMVEIIKEKETSQEYSDMFPCYRRMDSADHNVNPYLIELKKIGGTFATTELNDPTPLDTIPNLDQVFTRKTSHQPLMKPTVSPFNILHSSNSKPSIIYIIPWMVMGGADIYDLNVLKSFHQTHHITIVVERLIPNNDWEAKFAEYSDEIFNLQTMSNHSQRHDCLLDYLVISRRASVVINSRTIAGYRAFERWGVWGGRNTTTIELDTYTYDDGEGIFGNDYFPDWFSNNERVLDFKRHVFGSIKLVDILHLYNVGERSNWEWRGGRVAWAMTSRVVVSEDLKGYLIDVVRGGDKVLGIADDPSDGKNMWKYKPGDPILSSRPSFSENERLKFEVIYPPLEVYPLGSIERTKNNKEFYWWDKFWKSQADDESKSKMLPSRHRKDVRPTVFFLGRFDEQKDPLLWFKSVGKYVKNHHFPISTTKDAIPSPRLVLIGKGDMEWKLKKALETKYKFLQPYIEFAGALPHGEIWQVLAKSVNSVLMITSRFEGVPISGMEALALGIPVITMDCGGWREVAEDENIWDTKLEKSDKVFRSRLSSVLDWRCEGPIIDNISTLERPGWISDVFASEISYWLKKKTYGSPQKRPSLTDWSETIRVREEQLNASQEFRSKFKAGSFALNWIRLLEKIY